MVSCSTNAYLPGDVVQIQMSFIAFQIKSDVPGTRLFRLRRVLRSIALLNTGVREVRKFIVIQD